MVDYFDIRHTSPSIAFFFARLGVFLGSFSDHYPRVRDFVVSYSGLGLVLGSLCPLLHQSSDWFGCVQEYLRKGNMDYGVRSSDVETS